MEWLPKRTLRLGPQGKTSLCSLNLCGRPSEFAEIQFTGQAPLASSANAKISRVFTTKKNIPSSLEIHILREDGEILSVSESSPPKIGKLLIKPGSMSIRKPLD